MGNKFLANLKKGALHRELGIKPGTKIPDSKLVVKSTDTPLEKKRKQFAINAKKFKKSKSYDFGKAESKLGVKYS